jgi:hypothetical protein
VHNVMPTSASSCTVSASALLPICPSTSAYGINTLLLLQMHPQNMHTGVTSTKHPHRLSCPPQHPPAL